MVAWSQNVDRGTEKSFTKRRLMEDGAFRSVFFCQLPSRSNLVPTLSVTYESNMYSKGYTSAKYGT